MKEKVKAAPKELVRRGLDDGTERLRGQLRETAQHGQADDYGGDRIEDTTVSGARRAERGIENLLKKKKADRRDSPKGHAPSQEPPAPEPGPETDPPRSPAGGSSAPRPADQPRIKTREAVTAREGSTTPSGGGRTEPASAAGSEQQKIKIRESTVRSIHKDTPSAPRDEVGPPRIRTREAVVHEPSAGAEPVVQGGSERPKIRTESPQIKTKASIAATPSDHTVSIDLPSAEKPPERLSIKTKDAYIQSQPKVSSEPSSQALTQGQREFVQEHGRMAARKRAEGRRTGNGSVPQVKGGEGASPPAPVRRGYTSPVYRSVRPGNPDTQPVQNGGKAIVKTGRSVRKAPERTARHAIKTADRSARKTIKTTQRTAKTAARTTKTAAQTAKTAQRTAQATVKATQRAVQAVRATAKAAATTAKAAAKATVAAVKAAIAAIQALAAAIAAGGWVAIVIVLVSSSE